MKRSSKSIWFPPVALTKEELWLTLETEQLVLVTRWCVRYGLGLLFGVVLPEVAEWLIFPGVALVSKESFSIRGEHVSTHC